MTAAAEAGPAPFPQELLEKGHLPAPPDPQFIVLAPGPHRGIGLGGMLGNALGGNTWDTFIFSCSAAQHSLGQGWETRLDHGRWT